MTGSTRLIAVVVFLVALGVGVIAASLALSGTNGPSSASASASPPPSAVAQATATAATPPPSTTPEPSSSPSERPSAPVTSTPAGTARPSTAPGVPAAIAFTALKLDAIQDPDGQDRVITFRTQGSGTVSARLTTDSPQGEVIVCLRSASRDFGCQTTSDGTVTAPSPAGPTDFMLTLRGDGIATPIVDVALAFPADEPSVTIKHARFDGTGSPDSNGIDVTVTPRTDGDLHLVADWGGHPLQYRIDLKEVGGPGRQDLADQGPDVGVDTRLGVVAANPWRLVLANAEAGFGVTPMNATVAWP